MRFASKCGAAASLSAFALAAALPLQAQAQGMGGPWQWEVAAYGWFPGISGQTTFPNGNSGSIDLSTGDVIDALKFAMFANVGASNGTWGFFTDLMYADLGGSKSGTHNFRVPGQPLPIGLSGDFTLDAKTWMWTAVGTYTAISTPEHKLDVIGGLRMIDMTQTLDWSLSANVLPIDRSGKSEVSMTNWDAIIGVKGRAFLGGERTWFIPYYLDIGTGNSKFTWQGNLGIGYRFAWGAMVASWRYVDYNMKSDSVVDNFNFSGPLIGVVMTF